MTFPQTQHASEVSDAKMSLADADADSDADADADADLGASGAAELGRGRAVRPSVAV